VNPTPHAFEATALGSVRDTLTHLVLPHIEDKWAASYLRSSLSVLAAVDARLRLGHHADDEERVASRDLLHALGRRVATDDLEVLRAEVENALAGPPSGHAAEGERADAWAAYRRRVLEASATLWREAADLEQM
jgi:hypothetical protein